MTLEELQHIESTRRDYKASLEIKKPKSWLKTVSAFANTQGGHILFGITDDKRAIPGIPELQKTASKIAELITARITPHVTYTIEEVEIRPDVYGLDLCVSSGPHYPYYYVHEQTKECYIRHGDRSEPATVLELNSLILRGMNQSFDALPTEYHLSDVSFTLMAATFKKVTGEGLVLPRDLISMGCMTRDGQVTHAGLLLCDQGYMKQSRVVCTRWKGNVKGSIDGDALDDETFQGASLIMLLTNAEAFVRTNSKNPWTIRGMQREENSDYPFRAVREVLVNALIHRDYQNAGAEVHIDMFDDRMEISSPGGMMNGSCIQDLDLSRVPSMRRNEIVSDIFGRLQYMERRGSGIQRILNAYQNMDRQPEFYSNAYFFSVTLPNRELLMKKSQLRDAKNPLQGKKSQLSMKKTQLQSVKSQLFSEKAPLSTEEKIMVADTSQKEGKTHFMEKGKTSFRQNTLERLWMFFNTYGYGYSFNRKQLAGALGISENGASQIIRKALSCGLMRKEKRGVYYFAEE